MLLQLKYTSGLRSAILATLADDLQPQQLADLFALSRSMAIVLIRQKHQRDYLLQLAGLNEHDFAVDCVAELFRRDERGSFLALRAYFGSLDIANADDAAIAVYLRRLVSSAVNQGVSRAFNEVDPGLGKIIRNIKAATDRLKTFSELEVHFQSCIVPTYADPLTHLPFMEKVDLVGNLVEATIGGEKIPELLAQLATILRSQEHQSRAIPIVRAALVFRDVLALRGPHILPPALIEEPPDAERIRQLIEEACADIKTLVGAKYVAKNSLTQDQVDTYFLAIRNYFLAKVDKQDTAPTLHESLSEVGLSVPYAEYRSSHRKRLEYLARLVQKRAKRDIEN